MVYKNLTLFLKFSKIFASSGHSVVIHWASPSSDCRHSQVKSTYASVARSGVRNFVRNRESPSVLAFFVRLTAAVMAASVAVVEHVVLFKVRDGTDPVQVDAMVSNCRSLASLDCVLYLTAAPILRRRPASSGDPGFTHVLHSRHRGEADLAAYRDHPVHLSVVRDFILPICEVVLLFDWVGDLGSGPAAPQPGSAARVTLGKLKEGAGEEGKAAVVAALGGVAGSFPGVIEQFSYGEGISPAMANGYSLGSIALFAGVEELDRLETKGGDLLEAHQEKLTPYVESIVVVDFVAPPHAAATPSS